MRVIAIANHKGGTGKTTTAVNLAACLAERGKRCVILDLDPQAQASAWLGVHQDGAGILDVLQGDGKLADLVKPSPAVKGVSVIPGNLALSGAERSLAQEPGAELLLKRALGKLPAEYLLIDCRPGLGMLTLNALCAAHAVLIPVEAHPLGSSALSGFLNSLRVIRKRLCPGLKLAGILPCRVKGYTRLARETIAAMRKRYAGDVLPVSIRESTKAAEAPSHGKPLTLYARSHEVTQEYRKLAALILKRR